MKSRRKHQRHANDETEYRIKPEEVFRLEVRMFVVEGVSKEQSGADCEKSPNDLLHISRFIQPVFPVFPTHFTSPARGSNKL